MQISRTKHGLLTLYMAVSVVASTGETDSFPSWTKEQFPVPYENPAICHTESKRLCDPDSVLLKDDLVKVDAQLNSASNQVQLRCAEDELTVDVQYAVAITQKIYLAHEEGAGEVTSQAEVFARHVHDKWGVGLETVCGSTGILLFVSIEDRVIYISRGSALEKTLTDYRLDQIIDHMKSSMRMQLYGDAILQALHEMDQMIASGEPSMLERTVEWIGSYFALIVILLFVALMSYSAWNDEKNRREYASVQSKLSEIDQAHAEALQGRFQAVSCPICLESFPVEEKKDSEKQTGSDGKPLRLLRCGHVFDETCWEEWVSSGQCGVNRCPICRHQVESRLDPTREQELELTARHPHHVHGGEMTTHYVQDDAQALLNPVIQHDDDGILTRHRLERNFRLVRLALRYPRYVRTSDIQRWTNNSFDGPLARDPCFVNCNPARSHVESRGSNQFSNSSGFSSFGGGSSGGGRGGRW